MGVISLLTEWATPLAAVFAIVGAALSFRGMKQVASDEQFYKDLLRLVVALQKNEKRASDRVRSFSMDLLLPPSVAVDAQACLDEVYPIWIAQHGRRRARWIRRFQIIRIVVGHHAIPVLGFAERILRIVRGGKAAD